MRRIGSRESRESRDASATSPTSTAVNTFSIRFGSRRNQRPVHQKIRSITTVSAMIVTIRIGHMIGPPLRKLSIRKLPVSGGPLGTAAAAGEPDAPVGPAGDGERLPLKVALTLDPGAGDANAPVAPGATFVPPGATFVPPAGGAPVGGGIGAPGLTGAAGL